MGSANRTNYTLSAKSGSSSLVQVFDTASSIWLPNKKPFPVPNVYGSEAFVYMGKIFLVCTTGTKGIYEYDEANDGWTKLPGDISNDFDSEVRAAQVGSATINC